MAQNIDLNFDKFYKTSLTAMKINNSHPAIPRTKIWCLIFAIQHAFYTFTFVMLLRSTFICGRKGDFSAASKHSTLCVLYIVITFKHITLTANRKLILKLIENMKNDFKEERPYDEKVIVRRYAMRAKNVCIFWLYLSIIAGFSFPVKHLILEVYTIINGEFKLIEFYPLTYPSKIEDNKYHPLVYCFIYIITFYYMIYSVLTYIAMVPFGPIFILHACALLEIAKKRIDELNMDNIEEFRTELKKIIEILQYVYSFVDTINVVFGLVHEVILKATTYGIPLVLWEMKTGISRGEVSIEFISFILGGLLISISPCYYSQILMEKGNDIATLIYASGWENTFDRSIRKSVQIILYRAQRTVAIRSLFHEFGMEALNDLFHQTYGIFNVMNAIWK